MGTRNLTVVVKDGEYKVAQYGQWDGYPSYSGKRILNFLKERKSDLEDKLKFVEDMTQKELEKTYEQFSEHFLGSGFIDDVGASAHAELYPELSRDTGCDILSMIADFEPSFDKPILRLVNGLDFASDSLFCEWLYAIDFDKNTFEVYKGFNEVRLDKSDRFFDEKLDVKNQELKKLKFGKDKKRYNIDTIYYPVKLSKSFSLDNLPDEKMFLESLGEEVEE